jgi:hypothetical protein
MNPRDIPSAVASNEPYGPASDLSIPVLVARVYESAPVAERGHLLEPLLQPLGVLSLLGIAGGVFASVRFRSGWQDMHVKLEDVQNVSGSDVIALVEYAQRVSVEALDGLAQMLATSPLLACSAAAGLLVSMLMRRPRTRPGAGGGAGRASASPT